MAKAIKSRMNSFRKAFACWTLPLVHELSFRTSSPLAQALQDKESLGQEKKDGRAHEPPAAHTKYRFIRMKVLPRDLQLYLFVTCFLANDQAHVWTHHNGALFSRVPHEFADSSKEKRSLAQAKLTLLLFFTVKAWARGIVMESSEWPLAGKTSVIQTRR